MPGKGIKVCQQVFIVGGAEITSPDDCCIYLVDGGEEAALIDTGVGASTERILANVRDVGVNPAAIKYLFITHGHIDHIGGLKGLKDKLGARVVAHELELPALEQVWPRRTAADLYGVSYQPVTVEVVLQGEQGSLTVGGLELYWLHTPGHTPGGISVYLNLNGQRVLFGQDIHGPFRREWGSDLQEWRISMHKLLNLKADILGEGHLGVYSPAREVERYLTGMLRRYSG